MEQSRDLGHGVEHMIDDFYVDYGLIAMVSRSPGSLHWSAKVRYQGTDYFLSKVRLGKAEGVGLGAMAR